MLENLNPEDKVISSFDYSFDYSYSPRGNITQIDQAQGGYGSLEPGTTQLDFSYDETGQLVSSTLDPEGLPNLDLLGNPTGVGYQTNSLNQLLETPRYQLKYDLRGNLIEKINKISGKLISFEWNTENKLVRAQIYDNTDTLISELAYRYDALDRRVFKKLTHHQQPNLNYTRHYVYDGEDLIMELNADQNPVAFYVHAEGVDNPIAMLRDLNNSGSLEDGEVFFFTKDHLGSIREITNLRGEVLQRYDYKSYGEAKITKNDRLRDRLLENAFAFTGREVEIELGIYYYRARYYHPQIKRFISRDPVGFEGGDTNLYRYVENNPLLKIDPTGRVFEVANQGGGKNEFKAKDRFVECSAVASVGAFSAGAVGVAGRVATGPAAGACALAVSSAVEATASVGVAACGVKLVKDINKCQQRHAQGTTIIETIQTLKSNSDALQSFSGVISNIVD